MKIGEAAAASGCHQETIRYYERIGLLPVPTRKTNGYRVYSEEMVDRLRFIARGREFGFSLDEIRSLLRLNDDPSMSCEEVDVVARKHHHDILDRITELQRIADDLQKMIGQCSLQNRASCSILGGLFNKII